MPGVWLGAPLLAWGTLKIVYDVLLYASIPERAATLMSDETRPPVREASSSAIRGRCRAATTLRSETLLRRDDGCGGSGVTPR